MTENGEGQAGSCRHCGGHSSVASSIGPHQWCMFMYTFSCNIPTCCNQQRIQIWRIWRLQLRWDKFWSYFPDNSVVAHVRWIFQVSHSSVETLFRWDGKRLYDFIPNLFRKLSTNFYPTRPSFMGDEPFWHYAPGMAQPTCAVRLCLWKVSTFWMLLSSKKFFY